MSEPDVFVNEVTGEPSTLADYLAEQRRLEREILRLDVAIETHKECLKAAKDGKEKAIRDLRVHIRENKVLGSEARRRRRAAATKKGADA